MKKILLSAIFALITTLIFSQETPETEAPQKKPPINLSNRSNDHLLVQFGYTDWAGASDSSKPEGFSKSFNVYLMYDFPFKTNPKLSIGIGAGIGSDHIVFKGRYVGIKDNSSTIRFIDQSDTTHFKKTKLATSYLEAPIELRFMANPENGAKSFKVALGVKVGMLINAHTRNTKLEDKNGNNLNDYTMKESSKRFFNKNRLVGTARIGYGHFTLYGSYQLTTLFKDGAGPEVRPFSIGLTLSGL